MINDGRRKPRKHPNAGRKGSLRMLAEMKGKIKEEYIRKRETTRNQTSLQKSHQRGKHQDCPHPPS